MKTLILLSFLMVSSTAPSLYDFKMNSLDGAQIDFAKYRGKTLLIVNVASKCGFTPQYADLEKLHELYAQLAPEPC